MANQSTVGYLDNIGEATMQNSNFRQVLYTGKYCQLVVMSLQPGEEIGMEVHDTVDQFFRIEQGEGKIIMNDEELEFKGEFAIIVPAGTRHNVINTSSDQVLKLYTVYSPPNHPEGTVHATKADAMTAEEEEHKEE